MAIISQSLSFDVVKAAKDRIRNIFANELPVYFSFSGGKDSLVLAHLLMEALEQQLINASQLHVFFIDEEAIYPSVAEVVQDWRSRFLSHRIDFRWYCLPVKHFNAFNQLYQDESFICWDPQKEDVWIRQPPPYAIRHHPLLRPLRDSYQDWWPRVAKDGITITGVRAAESLQRLKNLTRAIASSFEKTQQMWPLYDWRDKDIWRYCLDHSIILPDAYLHLWQCGTPRNQLRISQFFSVDTARSLVKMAEYEPELMARIIRREPNAYLAALYWDTELFRHSSQRRQHEEQDLSRNYREETLRLLLRLQKEDLPPHTQRVIKAYQQFIIMQGSLLTSSLWRRLYDALRAGDPKRRTLRALYTNLQTETIKQEKEERK